MRNEQVSQLPLQCIGPRSRSCQSPLPATSIELVAKRRKRHYFDALQFQWPPESIMAFELLGISKPWQGQPLGFFPRALAPKTVWSCSSQLTFRRGVLNLWALLWHSTSLSAIFQRGTLTESVLLVLKEESKNQ